MWITLTNCGKERMFVDKKRFFFAFLSFLCVFYPNFIKKRIVIHKEVSLRIRRNMLLWISYPPKIKLFYEKTSKKAV